MFKRKSYIDKTAKLLLAVAPMFLGLFGSRLASILWVGEPEIPNKFKKIDA